MSWLRIDDGFAEHPKVDALSDRAVRIHLDALCYCARNLTDGLILDSVVAGFRAKRRAKTSHIKELIDAGLWVRHDGRRAWLIWDYLEYNPSKADVKAKRDVRAAAGRLGGLRSAAAKRQANA